MADSAAFTYVCEHLEANTTLDRLEARGTVRISLKEAGLEANNVAPDELKVVVQKILPEQLDSRGIDGCAMICSELEAGLSNLDAGDLGDSPVAVFARLGG
jgi:hypothetical protein